MVVDKINNAVVAKELLPAVWKTKPVRDRIVKIDIIGDLTPDRPVYVIKSWGSITPEESAYYYAAAADCEDEAVNKFIRYCKAEHKTYAFADETRYLSRCRAVPSDADRFAKYSEGYIEKAFFDIRKFDLKEFVVNYMKVM